MSSPRLNPKQRAARDKLKARLRLAKAALGREEKLWTVLRIALDRASRRADKLNEKICNLRSSIRFFQYDC